ncbi:MAG: hypothetical protein D6816_10055 [Bacteroidetes bacterium]|nr:MAG: hypothetical protein D6816_10055 [Bacteroidota bacterium]
MPTGTRLINVFPSDQAAVTARSEESALFPAGNVRNPYPGILWRSGGNMNETETWVKFDMGAAVEFDYCLAAGANFQSNVTVSVYATDDANLFSTFTDESDWIASGVFLGDMKTTERYGRLALSASVTYQYAIVFVKYPTMQAPSTGTHLGRLVFGKAVELPRAMNDGFTDILVDQSKVSKAGVAYSNRVGIIRDKARVVDLRWEKLDAASRANIVSVFESNGLLVPFFLDMYPDDPGAGDLVYGSFSSSPRISRALLDKFDLRISFEELLGVPNGSA